MAEAEQGVADGVGIGADDWRSISDPQPRCQHDWVAPVRVAQDADGHPIYGRFERTPDQPSIYMKFRKVQLRGSLIVSELANAMVQFPGGMSQVYSVFWSAYVAAIPGAQHV